MQADTNTMHVPCRNHATLPTGLSFTHLIPPAAASNSDPEALSAGKELLLPPVPQPPALPPLAPPGPDLQAPAPIAVSTSATAGDLLPAASVEVAPAMNGDVRTSLQGFFGPSTTDAGGALLSLYYGLCYVRRTQHV